MDAKQPGKGVYRVEYEAQEDEAGNAATELATFKNIPMPAGAPSAQPIIRDTTSPLASTAFAPQGAQPSVPPQQRPNLSLQRTLAMQEAPPHLLPSVPAAQPRRADPVPYLHQPSQTPQMPPTHQAPFGGAPPQIQQQQPQQQGHAMPGQRWEPPAQHGANPYDNVDGVAGVPTPGRGWLLVALILVGFIVAAIGLYLFLFRH